MDASTNSLNYPKPEPTSGSGSYFILSGEKTTLPIAELKALLEVHAPNSTLHQHHTRLFEISGTRNWQEIGRKGAYIRSSGVMLGSWPLKDVEAKIWTFNPEMVNPKFRSFAARIQSLTDGSKPEHQLDLLGHVIKSKFPKSRVDLDRPDIVFQGVVYDDSFFFGYTWGFVQTQRWYPRRPRAKPFFHPSAIYPKFSRALVNLARVKENEILLDPFCGTASLLVEAANTNIVPVGVDVLMKMCRGSVTNLNHLMNPFLGVLNADSMNIPIHTVHGIATDVPYGRCSSTGGRKSAVLMDGCLALAEDLLPPGRYACIVHPDSLPVGRPPGLEVLEEHKVYVHRNLTRVVTILRRN